jgi:DNA-directed RNA polymerase alpha subunit
MEARCPTCGALLPPELQLSRDTPIEHIAMSCRLRNTLRNDGIKTVGDAERILGVRIPNFGRVTQAELRSILGRASPAPESACSPQSEQQTKWTYKGPRFDEPIYLDTQLDDFIGYMDAASVRTMNCFKNESICTLNDLVHRTEAELLLIPNFGRRSLNEVKSILSKLGLSLANVVWIEGKFETVPGILKMANLADGSPPLEHETKLPAQTSED